jgi:ribosomal-protein-alanine N-acetyltransferase
MIASRIRPIESAHISDLIRIAEETNLNPWTAIHYIDELKNPNSILLRLESDDNATLGFIVGRVVAAADNEMAVDAEIYNIGIQPANQRNGFGQMLMDAFVGSCRDKLVRNVWLEVRESNFPAVSMYKKNGFQSVSIRKDFYTEPRENGILMRLNLGTTSPAS